MMPLLLLMLALQAAPQSAGQVIQSDTIQVSLLALALLLTNGSINVMTMIGIIMLMGLVTKNGILLIAGRVRLRPIIMTTAAMIFGMMPLALAIGAGAEQRAPMARAVIGGLITSTLLTLVVVPVMYTLLEDGVDYVRHQVPALFRRKAHPPAAMPPLRPVGSPAPAPAAAQPAASYRFESGDKTDVA